MTCREFIDFLMEYTEGAIPAAQRAKFDAHLAECPGCVDYLRTYQETVRLGNEALARTNTVVPEEVPEELVKAILAARASEK
jgi:anti-sigma factor RsiW